MNVIFSSIFYTYVKYLMSNKLLSLYIILPFFGFHDIIFNLIREIIGFKYGNNIMSFDGNLVRFSIFAKRQPKYIFKYLISTFSVVFTTSLSYLIYYKTILDFDTCHLGLIMIVSRLYNLIKNIPDVKRDFLHWTIIFLTIFLLINLLFFLEILEIKICKLNKNTRRNILLRERIEKHELEKLIEDDEFYKENRDSKCEVTEGYEIDMAIFNK